MTFYAENFMELIIHTYNLLAGLLIAVAPRYPYCSGATFSVMGAPLIFAESSGDSSAATFLALFATPTFKKENFSAAHSSESVFSPIHQLFTSLICFS